MGLVSELRRRNVHRMAVLYIVAAWLVMQVAEVLISLRVLPPWIGPILFSALAVGFPIALVLSWFLEITPEGIKHEKDVDRAESITHITGRRMDFIVIAMLSAAVILFAYHTWWPRGPVDQSIAVLPFENLSDDPDQEYFSDGLSEELLNLLAQFPELRVISRSSSFSYKGKDVDLRTIAEQLNVSHVLEGSVRRFEDRVRITAQLIDARSDANLWSESYERELGDIFVVQDQISEAIGEALKVEMSLVENQPAQPKVLRTISAGVYDEYLRGRERLRLRGRENINAAIDHFERVLRLDESFAPAHAQLAIAIILTAETLEETKREATPHLDRAEALEPNLAEAHGGRALLALVTSDPETAIEHAERALAVNPSYSSAMNWLQMSLSSVGRFEEALEVQQRILVIDPLDINGRFNYSWVLAQIGRIEEAHELADSIIAQDKSKGYWAHGQILLIWEGNIDEALFWFLKSQAELTDSFRGGYSSYPTMLFTWIGEYDEARRVADRVSYLVDVAEGRFDEAIETAQRAMQRDPDKWGVVAAVANVLYDAGRYEEALPLFERLRDFVQGEKPLTGSNRTTMRLAVVRRMAGDEEGARDAAQSLRSFLLRTESVHDVERRNHRLHKARAMLAAFERDSEQVLGELESAVRLGLRDRQVLDDVIFDELRDYPRFLALQRELNSILALEREQVLQLICFNNPTPDNWQPLPETCEGVEKKAIPGDPAR